MKNALFDVLKERLLELSHLSSTLSMLHWDTQVNMPKMGAATRATTVAYLAGLLHERVLSLDNDRVLSSLKQQLDAGQLTDYQAAVVRETWREFAKAQKLPIEFVKRLAALTVEAHSVWAEARSQANFQLFLPYLERIVDLKRQEAELVGYPDSPYDVHIDNFEPGMTTKEIDIILAELKEFLIPFIKKISQSPVRLTPKILHGRFPLEQQMACCCDIAEKIGYNFSCGRVDTSTHPFCTMINPQDVRVTVRFNDRDLFYALDTITHEVGHALYNQGVAPEHFGTPLAEFISYGIHESQSRLWEIVIGKGKPFWRYYYRRLKKLFPQPFGTLGFDQFYQALNYVKPSLIRTEADEVTYNLHIIMRFEIEKGLIEGTILPKDLPEVWNQKVKDYLGIRVPNDALGVLQDVHWSSGCFGYFPSYALGNLYAIQFYKAAERDLPGLEAALAAGHFQELREWLRRNIHMHGKRYGADELVRHLTGEPLNSSHFITYLKNKYTPLYQLEH